MTQTIQLGGTVLELVERGQGRPLMFLHTREGWWREISGARLDIIPAAGHFPHWEQPDDFVRRLSAFVDGRNA